MVKDIVAWHAPEMANVIREEARQSFLGVPLRADGMQLRTVCPYWGIPERRPKRAGQIIFCSALLEENTVAV